ncbi:MAG: DEAD/DEAH box helicase [Deltaproteobacteria bacterium]|nr:DEAD/DEAH box helicase [Deltaproteobacteria bacterium]
MTDKPRKPVDWDAAEEPAGGGTAAGSRPLVGQGESVTFKDFFRRLVQFDPHDWQARLALDDGCRDRLIRIPTGFGKTAGVTSAWLWNRVHQKNDAWPRRLVLCLPMRTLVEQTERSVADWIERAGLDRHEQVHVLLGGLSPSDWHLEPEREAVIIGTQDMLLSRALNRGYGSGRARWPMEHALLNVDCLWVMDEIQLMDVGLATSAQLQGFATRDERDGKIPRPRRTWWMSATLQREWLRRGPDLGDVDELPIIRLEPPEKNGPLWTVAKTVRGERVPAANDDKAERWAEVVADAHDKAGRGLTLAIANTVKSAVALYKALEKRKTGVALPADVDLRLVHSRFRGAERRQWATEFLAREQCEPGRNRIIVATQVVEAGVDISATALVTELSPWASLVQRFGRCARYGGAGQIVVVDRRHTDESAKDITAKDAAERDEKRRDADRSTVMPYEPEELEAAADAIASLGAAGPAALEALEDERQDLLPRLYPYAPLHVLSRRELRDLFDTGPDLTGADIDISRFVREGDERDVTVWWWPIPAGESPDARLRPAHDALCRVPIGDARKWLVPGSGKTDDGESAAKEAGGGSRNALPRAWVWSYLDGEWERLDKRHVYPGQTILVDAGAGGYDVQVGFTGKPGKKIPVVAEHARAVQAADAADAADEQEELSESNRQYKTIATHGAEVAVEVQKIAKALALHGPEARVLELAGLVHDLGKAHPAFAGAIKDRNGIDPQTPLAKAPKGRWRGVRDMYDHSPLGKRPGFRHELASALALLELAWCARPDHPALQGGREELLDLTVGRELPGGEDRVDKAQGMIAELIDLDATGFNLVAYVVMCHHGKVRATLPMSPRDQDNPDRDGNLAIRGVRDGDLLPALVLADTEGRDFELPQVRLSLQPARLGLSPRYGPSWVERVLALRRYYGDYQLTWFEALLRVADVRASRIAEPRDSRLPDHLVEVESVPTTEDRDAKLRGWIDETLAAAAAEPEAAEAARASARNLKEPKPPRVSTKKGRRGARGGVA